MALIQAQKQTVKGDRINKETGELSASGELSVSVDVTEGKVEGLCENAKVQELRTRLQELQGIHTEHRTDHEPSEEREEHLVKVLTLYIQVCAEGGRLEGLNIKDLAALTANHVIHNIHNRIAEKPAEGARGEVVQFFQRQETQQTDSEQTDGEQTDGEQTDGDQTDGEQTDGEQTDSQGWLLLQALLLMTANGSDTLLCINPGLPAALVKCLYLLVCLPAQKENMAAEETFQEPLTQVLLQLCRLPVNVERLVSTQELQCLIIGLTSLWDQTSAAWRHQASRVLKAVSAAATGNTVQSLLGKNCVRICIQNLLTISPEVPGLLLAQVAVAVFSFIRDTYALSPALFTEFDSNNGYKALEEILKRCEDSVSVEEFRPVEELLSLIASFTMFGKTELKVALCVSNPQPPGFKFDPPLTKGSAVKNLPAFHLLQTALLRSQDSVFCCQVLRTLQSVWERDPANFFLLEWTVQSMTQLAACVWRKPSPVQKLFFSMLEMVVFKMNYIPHETLRSLLTVLKQSWAGTLAAGGGAGGLEFGVVALKSFHRLTVHSGLLAEVFSDWGLLELLLGELRRRAKILRKAGGVSSPQINPQQLPCVEGSERLLTTCMLQVVSTLTLRSIKSTVSVRDLGMVPYIKIFLDEDQYRGPTLNILEQLAEINPEEFMSTAIGALCSSTQQELGLKRDLLQSIMKVLESPNSWDAFRRAGGFSGLLSLVTDMDGSLSDCPVNDVWKSLGHQPLLDLLLLTLHILSLAVHLHTGNAHYFETDGYYERLAEALLQLGCFHTAENHKKNMCLEEEGASFKSTGDNEVPAKSFHQFVELAKAPKAIPSPSNVPVTLGTCIRLLSYLEQFATGTYSPQELNLGLQTEVFGCDEAKEAHSGPSGGEAVHCGSPPVQLGSSPQSMEDAHGRSRNTANSVSTVGSEPQYRFTSDNIILHPGAVRVIMTLLPAVFTAEDPQLSVEVQYSLAHHIQNMVKSERNRQIMCEGGLVSTLLTHCRRMLLGPNHPLHVPVTRVLEKLSSQAITHSDFRKFLCLGDPLMCFVDKPSSQVQQECNPPVQTPVSNGLSTDSDAVPSVKTLKRTFSLLQSQSSSRGESVGLAVPVHQIISLVSMTSPRTFRPHRLSSSPAFVEFDMSESGYGCLFLPSLATVKGVTADSISTGGIGGDCRGFPPLAGLSFCCWFQINRFSSACDSHPLRLLSVVRHMSRTEQHYICLSVSFSAYDGCLVISTEEEAFTYLDMMEPEVCTPTSLPRSLRFRCSSMLVPGQWHHVTVVMSKDVKKSCVTSAYFNGKAVGTGKMRYIQPFPGQYVSMDPTAVIDVYGLIGTPPLWKEHAALVWRVGPAHLLEEALSPESVGVIYTQGTNYLGNFLALRNTGPDSDPDSEPLPLRLVPEERISFGINPAISTVTTVARIREDYNEVDCRLIAKEMGITSRDHSTPVFLARNISQHLSGTARTIGAALVGHFGVRTFTPQSASNGFLYCGGPAVVLSLVAMAPDDSSLYASVKVLLSVLETNAAMQQEMNRIHGYKLLAFLLKMKSSLISHRTFQLVLYLSSSLEPNSDSGCLKNTQAFRALLCDLEVWQNTSDNLDISVLNHFAEILKSSSDSGNAVVMHSVGLLPKLLFKLSDPTVTVQKVKIIACVVTSLLKAHCTPLDISRLGLFLVYTLPPLSNTNEGNEISDGDLSQDLPAQSSDPANLIWIRNQMLLSLCEILNSDHLPIKDHQKTVCEVLGSDWFLLFLQSHLHPSTVQLGLVLLTHSLSSPTQQSGFRDGILPATLIEGMEEPLAAMDNLRNHSWSHECSSSSCAGFAVLTSQLVRLTHLPQVYGALAAVMLGRRDRHTAQGDMPLDSVLQSLIDGQSESPSEQLCVEAATVLLELVRVISTQPVPVHPMETVPSPDASWELQFTASVMQFLCLLHNLRPRDPMWASPEFIHSLAGVVFAMDSSEAVVEPGVASDCEETFTHHSTRKPVCDFIRILLMDSLLNVSVNTNTHPLVLLLEFHPEGASLGQRQIFQTELLELIIDIIHMLSHQGENNTHLNSTDSESERPDGQTGTLMDNVVLVCNTLLQKLYSGMFQGEPECLLNFLADQIVVALEKGQTNKEKTVSALYSCTNKVLLYCLSLPRRCQGEKEVVVRALQTYMERWDVVMATYNSNVNFITCLLRGLLLIRSGSYPEGFIPDVHERKGLSQLFATKRLSARLSSRADVTTDDGELVSIAEACWLKVMTERQRVLEETFKIEISASQSAESGPVTMGDISPLWEENAHKAWLMHTESQKQKVASGSQRKFDLFSSAVRSALGRAGKESVTVEEFLSYMESHRQRGHTMFHNMRTNHLQLRASECECVSAAWLCVEAELLRERAVFGPGPGVMLTWDWVQDAAEGPNRTRARIRRKALRRSKRVLGTLGLGLRTGMSEENKKRADGDTEPKILCEVGSEAQEEEEEAGPDRLTFFPVLTEAPAVTEGNPDTQTPEPPEPCSHTQDCPDIRTILQELHPQEEVKAKMCVVMVSGLRVTEGVLLFGKDSLLLCEGFTLSSSGDVCCRTHYPTSVRDSFISSMLSKEPSARCRRWLYDDIKEARFMRFLLEDNAIEVFMKNGHSTFLVFLNRDHVSAYKRLCTVVSALKGRGVAEVIANARKTPVVEKTALGKWQRGEISNFEYLMHLNTIAGRTYNDLMQYPVFPWVLADYQSETLDLSNPATFRDLSKPMGAQTEKRTQMFIQRYEEVENTEEEGELSARCHYCTHYSSAIIVASFLVRMEPFSHTFHTLQGGFDIPERMFHSVKREWDSASRDNMSDVRELIPEFFYLPDFLLNSNHIQLGCMEDGTALGDVDLPPWAKGDAQEFIRVHREALESDYVSSNLHLWIDLIFGHKQRGPAAVESVNTFHPYFYAQRGRRGAKDPLIKSTILGYVSNFGQVPKQLFTKPHPPRSGNKKESPPNHPTPFFHKLDKLKTSAQPFRELPRGPVGQIVCLEKDVCVLERNRLLLSPLSGCVFSWGFPDNSSAFGHNGTEKTFAVCESVCDWGETLCAACPNPTTVVTAGTSSVVCVWDVAVTKDKLTHMKLRKPLYGHTDSVTCLAVSEVHSLIVSGSRDLTCILWDLEELSYITQLTGHTTSISALAINDLTGEIASCAGPVLYLWTMKGQLLTHTDASPGPRQDVLCVSFTQRHEWDNRNVIVTGCADGIIRIWKTEYTPTQLPGPAEEPMSPGRECTESDVSGSHQVKGWERHLLLSQELNRSKAVSQQRRFKNNPAVTALAMSRSHATLLAGDAWGRVFTWMCE